MNYLGKARAKIKFHLHCLRRITWQERVRNIEMHDTHIPNIIPYNRHTKNNHPHLLYLDVIRQDLRALDIDVNYWEDIALDHTIWREMVTNIATDSENALTSVLEAWKHAKQKMDGSSTTKATATFMCVIWRL